MCYFTPLMVWYFHHKYFTLYFGYFHTNLIYSHIFHYNSTTVEKTEGGRGSNQDDEHTVKAAMRLIVYLLSHCCSERKAMALLD